MNASSRTIAIALVALVVASWIGVGAFYMLVKPTVVQWTAAVTAAAIVTEVAFWLAAAHLGLRALKGRAHLWGTLLGLARQRRAS